MSRAWNAIDNAVETTREHVFASSFRMEMSSLLADPDENGHHLSAVPLNLNKHAWYRRSPKIQY